MQAVRYGGLSKRSAACESGRLVVKVHGDVVLTVLGGKLLVTFLLALKADGKSTANGMAQSLARVLAGVEAMTHPASRRTITADVREAALVTAIGSTEGNLLDGLVHD